MSFLKVAGPKIVGKGGNEVVLRGAGLGGWMNMENFITGYPGHEFQIREALNEAIGQEKSDFFFDKFLEYFFTAPDAAFFQSLGLNCIRLPFNYHHFEDDLNPGVLKSEGFKHLDRVIKLCGQHNIYTVLDLHAVPGGQNTDWHSDSGSHIANFWKHKHFQDRTIWLWTQLAIHYKDNTWVAGYNPLNEPTSISHDALINFYDRVYTAIRAEDPNHIIFFDGNTFATDFTHFGDAHTRWDNTAFSIHDYSLYGFPGKVDPYTGSDEQKVRMKKGYQRKREWMDERGLCVWNGEWGPVYARKEYEGDKTDEINKTRYQVLKAQLELYREDRLSWSIWLFKDIGFQGMVHVSPDTPYMRLFKDFLAKKRRMAVDSWGADASAVRHVYEPLEQHILQEVPEKYLTPYPYPVWKLSDRIARLTRAILVSEFLVGEWADHFVGLSEAELEELAKSFAFENCSKRDELNEILKENAKSFAGLA